MADPLTPKQTYASPLSYVGSTRRFTTWSKGRNPLLVAAGALGLLVVWILLVPWYVVVFGLFGLVTIPFRLFRRSQRKSLAVQEEQLRVMRDMAERDRAAQQG